MHAIEMHEVSDEFSRYWQAAGKHLQASAQDGPLSWLKANLTPPFLEHLSFRMEIQLYFIRVEDVDGNVIGPVTSSLFKLAVAAGIPLKAAERVSAARGQLHTSLQLVSRRRVPKFCKVGFVC
jgi:hypothetical protein